MGKRRGFFAQIHHSIREAERAQRREQRELLARRSHAQRHQAATDKEIERVQAATEKEIERVQAATEKEIERAEAEAEAAVCRNKIELLTSVHRQVTPAIDWRDAAGRLAPEQEAIDVRKSQRAQKALDTYAPGFFARFFNQEQKERRRLAEAARQARLEEERRRRESIREHAEALAEWEQQIELARLVLEGDLASYKHVVEETRCLAELAEVGCSVNVSFPSREVARASLRAQEADVVPAEEKSVTARGKLSTKKLPASRVSEIYQDFLCGAALRVARELFAVLPLRGVIVDVWTQLLNPASGHFEDAVVLSVHCPREGLERVNFENVDASDLVMSLRHSMEFTRGKGVASVTPLEVGGVP